MHKTITTNSAAERYYYTSIVHTTLHEGEDRMCTAKYYGVEYYLLPATFVQRHSSSYYITTYS